MRDFKGAVNPIYSCGSKIESTEHCLLCCQNQSSLRYLSFDSKLTKSITHENLENILLYGSEDSKLETNKKLIKLQLI